MTFKKYISQFYNDLGMTDEDIAGIMEVGPVTFDNYRRGYSPPGQLSMDRLLRRLAVRPADSSPQSYVVPESGLPFDTVDLDGLKKDMVGSGARAVRVSDGNMSGFSLYPDTTAIVGPCDSPKDGDLLYLRLDGRLCFRHYRRRSDGGAFLGDDGGETTVRPFDLESRMKIIGRVLFAVERYSDNE